MARLMRLTSIVLVFIISFYCMQIAVFGTAINGVYSADAQAEAILSLAVGDHVTMGKWEQDNKTNNGKEAIDWRVLAVDDNRALLIAEKGIDVISYDDDRDAVHRSNLNWETSSIRNWMNETFYSSAFTKEETERIMLSSVYVNDAYGEFTTDDHVFCLSEEETRRYFSSNVDMACQPTAYAKTKIKKNGSLDTAQYGIWWLRDMASSYSSSSAFNFMAAEFNESSYVFQQQGIKPYSQSEMWIIPYLADSVLVRPAMWIVLDTAKKESTQEPLLQHGNQVQAGNIDTKNLPEPSSKRFLPSTLLDVLETTPSACNVDFLCGDLREYTVATCVIDYMSKGNPADNSMNSNSMYIGYNNQVVYIVFSSGDESILVELDTEYKMCLYSAYAKSEQNIDEEKAFNERIIQSYCQNNYWGVDEKAFASTLYSIMN